MLSHGLLDALTSGGLGVALLWPISDARFFAPWRPIPVARIGAAFLSSRGLRVALTELALFAPAIAVIVLAPALLHQSRRVPAGRVEASSDAPDDREGR